MRNLVATFCFAFLFTGEAMACQHCKQQVIRVCEEGQKRPVCHDVVRCVGGTCGDESVTTFKNAVFDDSAVSSTVFTDASRGVLSLPAILPSSRTPTVSP